MIQLLGILLLAVLIAVVCLAWLHIVREIDRVASSVREIAGRVTILDDRAEAARIEMRARPTTVTRMPGVASPPPARDPVAEARLQAIKYAREHAKAQQARGETRPTSFERVLKDDD